MARKPQQPLVEDLKELTELIDEASSLLDRTKVMYEQHFLGIQKLPPAQLHRDLERRIRELTQRQIRNTAARYRLANLSQKFGSYNTYWRRTLREIEQGRYVRDMARVQRRAQRTGQDVPDEILANMPKRMRDRVLRDRELLAKRTARAEGAQGGGVDARGLNADAPAAGGKTVREQKPHAFQLEDDLGVDLDELFRNLTSEAEDAVASHTPPPRAATPPPVPPKRAPTPPPVPPARAATLPPVPPTRAATPPPVPPTRASTPPPVPPNARAQPAGQGAGDKKPALPPGMTEAKTRALYDRYLQARAQTGKATNIRYEELVRSLNQQAPALMKKHNAAGVEFDVQVKGDKVVLKAKPKR